MSIVEPLDWPTLGKIERFIGEKNSPTDLSRLSPKKNPEPGKKSGKPKAKKPTVKNKKAIKKAAAKKSLIKEKVA